MGRRRLGRPVIPSGAIPLRPRALRALWAITQGARTGDDIARMVGRNKSAIVPALDELEDLGLIAAEHGKWHKRLPGTIRPLVTIITPRKEP